MPRTCTICRNRDRDEINLALHSFESVPSIATRFGVSRWGLYRHWKSGHAEPSFAGTLPAPDTASNRRESE